MRSAAGMECWWALLNLAGAGDENPLVLASRRQCWAIAQGLLPRIHDPADWRVRVELCAASLLRTRDEDDGGVPLGVAPGSHGIRMHPVTRATYLLAQGLSNAGLGISQPQATLALAAPAVRAFGDLCPQVVADLGRLLGTADGKSETVADTLQARLHDFRDAPDLRAAGVPRTQWQEIATRSLRTFNCNADGWMDDKLPRLAAMLEAVL